MSLSRDILLGNKKVFVCFDYDNDRNYKNQLYAIARTPRFSVNFCDELYKEIAPSDIGSLKAMLSKKIGESTHTLVIIGEYANALHRDYTIIGYKNWINYEIARSREMGKKLIAVKLDPAFDPPEELLNSKVKWVDSFNVESIIAAIK